MKKRTEKVIITLWLPQFKRAKRRLQTRRERLPRNFKNLDSTLRNS